MKAKRNTVAKEAVITLFKETEAALSHADIRNELGDLCNRVTIYRILDRLEEEGMIHRIMDVNGVARYAACKSGCETQHQHNHVHFSCEQCKQVTCLETVQPTFSLPQGYEVKAIQFTVVGVCATCGNS